MGAPEFANAFSLLTCLAAGLLFFQGIQAARYRGERANKPVALAAAVLAVAALVCFAARLGHAERLFGGFSNITSGITLLLYAVVLFVVVAVVLFVASLRSEDASVPAWCGIAAVVVSVLLMVCSVFGSYTYVKLSALTPDVYALAFLRVATALSLGSLATMVVAQALGEESLRGLARATVLPAAVLAGIAIGVYLLVFQLGADATAVASKSAYSMTSFAIGNGAPAASTAGATSDVVSLVLTGGNALMFWLGAVGCGVVVPAAAGIVAHVAKKSGPALLAAGMVGLLCALVGGWALCQTLAVLGV